VRFVDCVYVRFAVRFVTLLFVSVYGSFPVLFAFVLVVLIPAFVRSFLLRFWFAFIGSSFLVRSSVVRSVRFVRSAFSLFYGSVLVCSSFPFTFPTLYVCTVRLFRSTRLRWFGLIAFVYVYVCLRAGSFGSVLVLVFFFAFRFVCVVPLLLLRIRFPVTRTFAQFCVLLVALVFR